MALLMRRPTPIIAFETECERGRTGPFAYNPSETVALTNGARLGSYEIVGLLGSGGPAFVRPSDPGGELRPGLAEAKLRTWS